jgi:hypothetical protein
MSEHSTNGNGNPNPAPESAEDMRQAFERFLDHQKKAIEETGKAIDALLPTGFKEHGTEARREFIKGFKVLVDTAIGELEKASREFEKARTATAEEGGDEPPATTGKTKVKVQVD